MTRLVRLRLRLRHLFIAASAYLPRSGSELDATTYIGTRQAERQDRQGGVGRDLDDIFLKRAFLAQSIASAIIKSSVQLCRA